MTMNDRLEAHFKAHPNVWIDGRHLSTLGGYAAYRTRISELRVGGMNIQNRVRRIPKLLSPTREKLTISEYRLVVHEPVQLRFDSAVDSTEGRA